MISSIKCNVKFVENTKMYQTGKQSGVKLQYQNNGLRFLLCVILPLLTAGVCEWILHKIEVSMDLGSWSLLFMLSLSLPGAVMIAKLNVMLFAKLILMLLYVVVYTFAVGFVSLLIGMRYLGL